MRPESRYAFFHRFQPVFGLLGELSDADIANVVVLDLRTHRLDVDEIADDGEVLGLLLGAWNDLELHGRIDRAAHFLDRLIERQPLRRLVVDRGDDVAREDARLGRRRIVDRGHDLDEAVLLRHLDTQAANSAFRLDLHVAELFCVHVARMRVEEDSMPLIAASISLDSSGFRHNRCGSCRTRRQIG